MMSQEVTICSRVGMARHHRDDIVSVVLHNVVTLLL